jgi:hypothetical protein
MVLVTFYHDYLGSISIDYSPMHVVDGFRFTGLHTLYPYISATPSGE